MKKIFYILMLCLFSVDCLSTNFYVSTTGNDNNTGTLAQPWATWGHAFTSTSVNAGDTVFIRGGVYNITVTNGSGYGITRAGTSSNWIVYMNYPGESPILDCAAAVPSGQYNTGISCSRRTAGNYVKLKGLTVRNVLQNRQDVMVWAIGFSCDNGFYTFENCVAYNIQGVGFESYFYDGWSDVNGIHRFINCDAYNCSNPEVIPGYLPGNNGSGFSSTSFTGTQGHAYAIGCRAWNCGDQGFVFSGEHYCETTNCWSFNNGDLQGDGHGFKIGWHSLVYPETGRLNVSLKNCISAYNRYSGITTNDAQGVATGMNVYNNLIYGNGHYGSIYGTYIYDTPDNATNELLRVFRNNISFDNEYGEIYVASGASYTHSNNSWDGGATVTSADFAALPASREAGVTLLMGARQADGSLPNLGNYFKLAEGSDAIDAGIDVGLPYSGAAPDLGPFETLNKGIVIYGDYIVSLGNYIVSLGLPATGTIEIEPTQIIADHTIVDRFDDIPQFYLNEVKKMWVSIAGESHSQAYRTGMILLESSYPNYAVSVVESGTPEAYTSSNLRFSRATWGDYSNSSGWIYDYGEEDWFTNSTAIARTKAGLLHNKNSGPELSVLGFGWCYDGTYPDVSGSYDAVYGTRWGGATVASPQGEIAWGLDAEDQALTGNSVSMQTYIDATNEYINYCTTNSISTKVIFTTGPIDAQYAPGLNTGEIGYQQYLKYKYIRDYVAANPSAILFDYADILSYNNAGVQATCSWTDHNSVLQTYPLIHSDNEGGSYVGHIGSVGAIRLAKAMWWMLARIAGWDGN